MTLKEIEAEMLRQIKKKIALEGRIQELQIKILDITDELETLRETYREELRPKAGFKIPTKNKRNERVPKASK